MALMGPLFLDYFLRGVQPLRRGNALPEVAPCGVYPCRGNDKWLALAVADESEWSALVAALGSPALAETGRLAGTGRLANSAGLSHTLRSRQNSTSCSAPWNPPPDPLPEGEGEPTLAASPRSTFGSYQRLSRGETCR